ncbi:UbiA prenyltransferase family-domain-containing protein [Stachybotrys elegans]|uniref:UbiA prenyltransferase family-domain-containing protein n=1 Tax=Stachybotrys elegans TaxID=80388 RepID=A0A8K0T0N5_9HYPO|nr:UbiA prenyltransferase family-domain-containing protein [Stachybotrys elegans]
MTPVPARLGVEHTNTHPSPTPFSMLKSILVHMRTLQLFIESNLFTFAVPNTAFGIFGAMAASILVDAGSHIQPSAVTLLQRFPLVLLFNVTNLLVFDLANQRSEASVLEDGINKPWRPIPQGRITMQQTRRLMLVVIPMTLAINYTLGVWTTGLMINIITWMYNDLQGGDEPFFRDFIIAIAYGLFNSGSLAVAVGSDASLSLLGLTWTVMISGVILTTMQIQDLKDQKGDKTRSRKTMALFLGDRVSRVSIVFFVCFWTVACCAFWSKGAVSFIPIAALGGVVVVRLLLCSLDGDAATWRWWCLWHASLYTLPLFERIEGC